jgi:hypothetical protein
MKAVQMVSSTVIIKAHDLTTMKLIFILVVTSKVVSHILFHRVKLRLESITSYFYSTTL